MGKFVCKTCGVTFVFVKTDVYPVKKKTSKLAEAVNGIEECDAVDCPNCWSQNVLAERRPRIEAEPEKELAGKLNALAVEIHENALAHGWWDAPRSFPEVLALVHSELSEALEEYRDGKPMLYYVEEVERNGKTIQAVRTDVDDPNTEAEFAGHKPHGIAVELADAMIRILDYCGRAEIDIEDVIRRKHEYNKTRPYRHGGKLL